MYNTYNGTGYATGLIKSGSGLMLLTGVSSYTGSTTVNGGTLQLNTANGQTGQLLSSTIAVNAGGILALNATDVIGWNAGTAALVINGGTVANTTAACRITLANNVTMTGGVLSGSGTGDGRGVYSFYGTAGVVATSDAAGNAAIINAASISLESNNVTFNVARARPARRPT